MNLNPVIVIMAKEPAVGQTKTRLCPPLTPQEAANLYEALLLDTITLTTSLSGPQVAIAITPPESIGYFRSICPPSVILLPVSGLDIGDCLNQTMIHFLEIGYSGVLALNSDGPTLPKDYLRQAIDLLNDTGMVLGPSEDGGYYLIGLKQPHPELFQDISWSTGQVTTQTLAQAKRLGLKVATLPAWYDVDTIEDLNRLKDELETLPPEALSYTRRFIAAWTASAGQV